MRSRYFWVGAGILILVAASVAALLNPLKNDGETKRVKVMVALPIGLQSGQEMANAAQLALDQAGGKAGNVEVELIFVDTFNPEETRNFDMDEQAAQQAAEDEQVVAYLGGSNTSRTRRSINVLNEANLIMISPSTTWPGFTMAGFGINEPGTYYPTGRRTFFRVTPNDNVLGVAAARWLKSQGYTRIFILAMDDPYSIGSAGIMEANAADHDLNIIGNEIFDPINSSDEDLEQLAAQIAASDAEALYYPLPNTGSGYRLITALLEADPDIVIIAGDGIPGEPLLEDQTHLDRLFATSVKPTEFESAQAFIQAYSEVYGVSNARPFVLMTYEAMQVILKAIAEADEPTRIGVLDAMHNLGEFSGAMGTWSFDEHGDTTFSSISIMTIRDGQWVVVDVVDA